MSKPWIGVDLDGTLAHWEGWKGIQHIGKPIPKMVRRIKQWISEGKTVKIFTARVDGGIGLSALDRDEPGHGAKPKDFHNIPRVKAVIRRWCLEHIGQELEITNQKDGNMTELWDDRAIQVIKNTGRTIEEELTVRLKRAAKVAAVQTKVLRARAGR